MPGAGSGAPVGLALALVQADEPERATMDPGVYVLAGALVANTAFTI